MSGYEFYKEINEVQLLVSLRNSEVKGFFFFFFNGKDTERKRNLFKYSVQLISEKELRRRKIKIIRRKDKKEKKSQIPSVAFVRWKQRKFGK